MRELELLSGVWLSIKKGDQASGWEAKSWVRTPIQWLGGKPLFRRPNHWLGDQAMRIRRPNHWLGGPASC